MKTWKGSLVTNYWSIIPILLGISKSVVDDKAIVYALHITPFFELGINVKKRQTKNE